MSFKQTASKLGESLKRERVWTLAAFLTLFFLSMLRFCGFGTVYYPQLDDYIQYHNYPQSDSFLALANKVGLFAYRPLSGVADYFLWGPHFGHMLLVVTVLTALYVASMMLLRRLLQRYFEVSPLFLVITCLLPLGMEGLYWVSASSRIVMGLFFAVLAVWAFARFLDTGRWTYGVLYGVLQILPFGFYEQCAVLSMMLVLGMAILEFKTHRKRTLLALWTLGSMAVYFLVLRLINADNPYAERTELVLPTTSYYWGTFLPRVLRQMAASFAVGGALTTVKGFARGLTMLFAPGQLLWLLLVALGCGALCWLLLLRGKTEEKTEKRENNGQKSPWLALLAGFLLAVAPVTPFFLLESGISLRGTVPSFAGFALMVEAVLTLIFRSPVRRKVTLVLSVGLALVFLVASLSEIHDYKETYEFDQRIAKTVAETLSRDQVPTDEKVGVLNVEATSLTDQNFYYHEHIHGCTESDWAFSGLLTAVAGPEHPDVIPMGAKLYESWNRDSRRLEAFDRLYYFDGKGLVPVTAERTGENAFDIRLASGTLLGTVREDEGQNGWFEQA